MIDNNKYDMQSKEFFTNDEPEKELDKKFEKIINKYDNNVN